MRRRGQTIVSLILGVAVLGIGPSASQAQIKLPPPIIQGQLIIPYTMLHNFDCNSADGCNPGGPAFMAQGRDGNLYGTLPINGIVQLPNGGKKTGGGTLFSIPTNLTANLPLPVLYTLGTNGSDGFESESGLTLGMDGMFYGTAVHGGGANGVGSVFRFGPAWSLMPGFSPLNAFINNMDGAFPWAPPIQAPDGNLYGVTFNGTAKGTIYRITPMTGFSVIATLGVDTKAPLVPGFDGNLYGTTQSGSITAQGTFSSTGGNGVIFRVPMSATGSVQITPLHSFDPQKSVLSAGGQQVPDGLTPVGPVMFGQDGNLYGTTTQGGSSSQGVIYQLNPNTGAYKVLHSFTLTEGSGSTSGLVQGSDGFLYGVAPTGGSNGLGTLFKVNTAGTSFQVLWSFGNTLTSGGNDGMNPYSTPTLHTNGKLYGVTFKGGPKIGYGTIYSFDAGLKPFVSIVGGSRWVNVGSKVGVIGQGFNSTTGVLLGSTTPLGRLSVQVFSDTYMEVTVPGPGLLGRQHITVQLPSGKLTSPQFLCTPPPPGVTSLC